MRLTTVEIRGRNGPYACICVYGVHVHDPTSGLSHRQSPRMQRPRRLPCRVRLARLVTRKPGPLDLRSTLQNGS